MVNILLADDDAGTRELVRRGLESDGHSVTVAEDGEAALEKVRSDAVGFQLVITDIQMPTVDGFQLVAEALKLRPSLRFVLMSGYAGALRSAETITAAPLVVIAKPFTLKQLRAAVQSVLA